MSLKQRLIEQITLEGPMTIADYMHRCLLDPQNGYYTKHVRFGEDGDFITAPMVSQMFGEMVGVWVAQVWQNMGSPSPFRLVEVGAGRGELMSDILRVVDKMPGMRAAATVTFVEPSPALAVVQTRAVENAAVVGSLDQLATDMPFILVANEVLDCLPARQFVLTERGWCERLVGVRDGELAFGLVETPEFAYPLAVAPGEIVEISAEQARFARQICEKLEAASGAALLIDYGRDQPGTGDTLQALHRHQKHAVLEAPGEHDLTLWADFPAVCDAAHKTHVKPSPVIAQSSFLKAMGIDARFESLKAQNQAQVSKLERQYERLMSPEQMGNLFKVVGLAWPPSIALPALEAAVSEA